MNKLLPLFLIIGFFACQNEKTSTAEKSGTKTEEPSVDEWINLFDGASLDQWKAYGKEALPAEGWVADNGEMVIQKAPKPRPEGFGGDIITKEKFGNFELQLDFMTTDTANSGIFYFVVEEEGSAMWFNAPEYQILDDKTYIEMRTVEAGSSQLTGSNYDLQAAPEGLVKAVGEWNSARILHKDGHVEHWLNGTKTCEYQVDSPEWNELVGASKFKDFKGYGRAKEGHIGLQDHDHEVRFKNIKIRSL